MKWDELPAIRPGAPPSGPAAVWGHDHALARAHASTLSRRRFLQGAAGAAALGAAAGAAVVPGIARADGPGLANVVPIPSTVEFFPGVFSHVQGPPFLGGPDADPSTVYNFEGTSGIAFISGMVDRRNRRTGEVRSLPYLFNDMRFMQGRFRDRHGHLRNGTFAFI